LRFSPERQQLDVCAQQTARNLLKLGPEVCRWNGWLGKQQRVPVGKGELRARGDKTAATTFHGQLVAHLFCSCTLLFIDAHFSIFKKYGKNMSNYYTSF